jgi:hypothetical protein
MAVLRLGKEFLFNTRSYSKMAVFRLGEEFDELTADGRQVRSKMTLQQPNVMVHEMKGTQGGKDSGMY